VFVFCLEVRVIYLLEAPFLGEQAVKKLVSNPTIGGAAERHNCIIIEDKNDG
jgi:hypothetical protein